MFMEFERLFCNQHKIINLEAHEIIRTTEKALLVMVEDDHIDKVVKNMIIL